MIKKEGRKPHCKLHRLLPKSINQHLYVRVQLDALQVQARVAEEDLEVVDIPAPRLQAREGKGGICRYVRGIKSA